MGLQTGTWLCPSIWTFLRILEIGLALDPAIALLEIYPKDALACHGSMWKVNINRLFSVNFKILLLSFGCIFEWQRPLTFFAWYVCVYIHVFLCLDFKTILGAVPQCGDWISFSGLGSSICLGFGGQSSPYKVEEHESSRHGNSFLRLQDWSFWTTNPDSGVGGEIQSWSCRDLFINLQSISISANYFPNQDLGVLNFP